MSNDDEAGFESLHPKGGADKKRLDEIIDLYPFPKKKWVQIRFLPKRILAVKQHWVSIRTKDGKEVNIPKLCIEFDPATEGKRQNVSCPYCKLPGQDSTRTFYLANAILREDQEEKPQRLPASLPEEKRTGFKDLSSRTWTPVKVFRLPAKLASDIQSYKELNVVKKNGERKEYDVSSARYGMDISIKFDPDAKGAAMYMSNTGDKTPLTEEETAYLTYDLSEKYIYGNLGLETEEHANSEVKRMTIIEPDNKYDKKPVPTRSVVRKSDEYDLGDDEPEAAPVKKERTPEQKAALRAKKKKRLAAEQAGQKKKAYDDDGDDSMPF